MRSCIIFYAKKSLISILWCFCTANNLSETMRRKRHQVEKENDIFATYITIYSEMCVMRLFYGPFLLHDMQVNKYDK